jgi:hypothetical protein
LHMKCYLSESTIRIIQYHIDARRAKQKAEHKANLKIMGPLYEKRRPPRDKAWRRCVQGRRRAKKRQNGPSDRPIIIQAYLKKAKHSCYWCGKRLGKVWHADHVTPLCRGGQHIAANIVKSCPACNLAKSGSSPNDWIKSGQLVML